MTVSTLRQRKASSRFLMRSRFFPSSIFAGGWTRITSANGWITGARCLKSSKNWVRPVLSGKSLRSASSRQSNRENRFEMGSALSKFDRLENCACLIQLWLKNWRWDPKRWIFSAEGRLHRERASLLTWNTDCKVLKEHPGTDRSEDKRNTLKVHSFFIKGLWLRH